MRLLVTGGMGFIGRAVIGRLLDQGIEKVVVLDNLLEKVHGPNPAPSDFGDPRVQFLRGDVCLRANVEPLLLSSDLVLHLAAETGTGESMYQIERYSKVNISATALMLDILTNKKHTVKKLVVASSRAIYGEGRYACEKHGVVYPRSRKHADMTIKDFEVKCPFCGDVVRARPTTEDSVVRPISFYGITKQLQEEIVMTLCPNLGIAPVALRYQNVYGPGQSLRNPYTGILSVFANRIRQNKPIEVFEDGRESRDFVYIEDAAAATANALLSDKADGEALNIGTGVPVSILEAASLLRELLGSNVDIAISGNFRVGDIRHNYADINKARALLGFDPKYSLQNGLAKLVEWVNGQELATDRLDQAIDEMRNRGLHN